MKNLLRPCTVRLRHQFIHGAAAVYPGRVQAKLTTAVLRGFVKIARRVENQGSVENRLDRHG
jgi:hypothetical protein